MGKKISFDSPEYTEYYKRGYNNGTSHVATVRKYYERIIKNKDQQIINLRQELVETIWQIPIVKKIENLS